MMFFAQTKSEILNIYEFLGKGIIFDVSFV